MYFEEMQRWALHSWAKSIFSTGQSMMTDFQIEDDEESASKFKQSAEMQSYKNLLLDLVGDEDLTHKERASLLKIIVGVDEITEI